MATKWKYADIDAEHRLNMLRNGNKELFLEETARTKEITDARRALGLDTTEQEKWMDTVGYNYNQSLASEGDIVSKTGYSDLYLNEKKQDTKPSTVKANKYGISFGNSAISQARSKISNAEKSAKQALEKEYEALREKAKQDLYDKYSFLEEAILNSGGNLNGGKLARAYEYLETRLDEIYDELADELQGKLTAVENKYGSLIDEVLNSKKSTGTVKNGTTGVTLKNSRGDNDDAIKAIKLMGKDELDDDSTEKSKDVSGEVTEIQDSTVEIAQDNPNASGTMEEKDYDSVKQQLKEMLGGNSLTRQKLEEIASLIVKLLSKVSPKKV